MNLREKGERDRVIYIDYKANSVTYLFSNKTRSLRNPEESIQLDTYLQIIFKYNYPPELVRVCERVKMGSSSKEADIIIYKDFSLKSPYIIVECKKQGVSDNTFNDAIDQGFSYAVSLHAAFIWVTSGTRNHYYKVWHDKVKERELNRVHDIPSFEKENSVVFKILTTLYWLSSSVKGTTKNLQLGKIPYLATTFLYIGIIAFFHLILSKAAVEYHPEIYKLTKWMWEKLHMNFQWIFNTIGFSAALLGLTFTNLFLNNQHKIIHKKKKSDKLFWWLAIILFIPIWYSGEEQINSWWVYSNFNRLDFKTNIYFMPFLESLLFLFPITYILIIIIQKYGR